MDCTIDCFNSTPKVLEFHLDILLRHCWWQAQMGHFVSKIPYAINKRFNIRSHPSTAFIKNLHTEFVKYFLQIV